MKTVPPVSTFHFAKLDPLIVSGEVAGIPVGLVIDSGSSLTLINQKLFSRLPFHLRQRIRYPPSILSVQLPDASHLRIRYALSLPITIANSTCYHTVYVVPQLSRLCIIGNDLIKLHNLQIDGGQQTVHFDSPHYYL